MKLLKQDNKIVLYDDIHDKYIPIYPDDLNYILDDNNKLRDNETIINYFKFKHNDFKENKKGYTSKKIDLGKQQDETLKNINKDYLTQSFLSKVNGLSELDRIAFIKNPSISTIKRFSTDSQTINRLIKVFEDIKKTTIEIRDNGNDIDDMINYIITNDVKVSIPKAIKTTLETHVNNFLTGKITKTDLIDIIAQNRHKFKNTNDYNAFVRILTKLEPPPKEDKEDKEDKEVTHTLTKSKEDKEVKEVKEFLNNAFKEEQTIIINKDDFNDEGYNEAVNLKYNNQLTPENIFKTSNIKRINKNEIANNSKIYRVLSYLKTNNLLNQDNIKVEDLGDIHKYIITIPKKGTLTFSLHKNGYLSEDLSKWLENINGSELNDIFKNQTYNDIYNYSFATNVEPLKFEYKQINKPFSKEYDDEKEELKKIIDAMSNDISKQEFDDIIYKYYETYDINEGDIIEPDIINVNQYYKTNKEYKDIFKNPPNSLLTRYGKDFFNIIPFSFWSSNLPEELIKEYKSAYNFKTTVFNTFDKIIKDIKQKTNDDKRKALEEIEEKINDKKEEIGEKNEAIKKDKKEIENLDEKYQKTKKIEEKNKLKDQMDYLTNEIYNIQDQNKELEKQIDELNKIKANVDNEFEIKSSEINEILIDGLFDKFKDNIKDPIENDEQIKKIDETKEKFIELFDKYFDKEPKYYTKLYNANDNRTMPQTSNETMRRTRAFERAREQETKKLFEGMGGKTWSYTILKKIDELNDRVNDLSATQALAKSSNGRLYLGGKTWSYTILKKIDELNELINKFN